MAEEVLMCRAVIAQIFVYPDINEYFQTEGMKQNLPTDSVDVFKKRGVDKKPNCGYNVKDLLAALPPIDMNRSFYAAGGNGLTDVQITKKFLNTNFFNKTALS